MQNEYISLCEAAEKGNINQLSNLLKQGHIRSQVNKRNDRGFTPLQLAVKFSGNTSSVNCLLNSGANPNIKDTTNQRTACHEAASLLQIENFFNLVSHGGSLTQKDKFGWTPLEVLQATTKKLFENSNKRASDFMCQLFSWGFGSNFQLGHETAEFKSYPKLIKALRNEDIADIACSKFHSVACTAEGKLFTFGFGGHGRLGHGDDISQILPKQISELNYVNTVCCSSYHTVITTSTGEIYSWGRNEFGQLGHGDRISVSTPKKIKGILDNKFIQKAQCGAFHTACMDSTQQLFTFGRNDLGQCGNTGQDEVWLYPRQVSTFVDQKIADFGCGIMHTIVLIASSSDVLLCGFGKPYFRRITFPSSKVTIQSVTSGPSSHVSLAISEEGAVFYWFGEGSLSKKQSNVFQDLGALTPTQLIAKQIENKKISLVNVSSNRICCVTEDGNAYESIWDWTPYLLSLPACSIKDYFYENDEYAASQSSVKNKLSNAAAMVSVQQEVQLHELNLHNVINIAVSNYHIIATIEVPRGKYVDESSEKSMNMELAKYVGNGQFSDFFFSLGADSIYAHKALLMCRSPFFRSLFMKNPEKDSFDVSAVLNSAKNTEEVRAAVFCVLHYMYTDQIKLRVGVATSSSLGDQSIAQNVLKLSEKFQLERLRSMIVMQYLRRHKNSSDTETHGNKNEKRDSMVSPSTYFADLKWLFDSAQDSPNNADMKSSFSDITIQLDRGVLSAHKIILASCGADFFNAILFSGMKESQSNSIYIGDVAQRILKHVMHFLYCTEVDFSNPQMAVDMLIAAEQLTLYNLKNLAAMYLSHVVDQSNLLQLLCLAQMYQERSCYDYILKYAGYILTAKDFDVKEIEPDSLKSLGAFVQKRVAEASLELPVETTNILVDDEDNKEEWTPVQPAQGPTRPRQKPPKQKKKKKSVDTEAIPEELMLPSEVTPAEAAPVKTQPTNNTFQTTPSAPAVTPPNNANVTPTKKPTTMSKAEIEKLAANLNAKVIIKRKSKPAPNTVPPLEPSPPCKKGWSIPSSDSSNRPSTFGELLQQDGVSSSLKQTSFVQPSPPAKSPGKTALPSSTSPMNRDLNKTSQQTKSWTTSPGPTGQSPGASSPTSKDFPPINSPSTPPPAASFKSIQNQQQTTQINLKTSEKIKAKSIADIQKQEMKLKQIEAQMKSTYHNYSNEHQFATSSISESNIDSLLSMGFSRAQAIEALRINRDNLEQAVNFLL